MAMLDTVKKAMRITHSELDDEIKRNIAAAEADLTRTGIAADIVAAEGELVTQAVISYCLAHMGEDPDLMEKYMEAYRMEADAIRKSKENYNV